VCVCVCVCARVRVSARTWVCSVCVSMQDIIMQQMTLAEPCQRTVMESLFHNGHNSRKLLT